MFDNVVDQSQLAVSLTTCHYSTDEIESRKQKEAQLTCD